VALSTEATEKGSNASGEAYKYLYVAGCEEGNFNISINKQLKPLNNPKNIPASRKQPVQQASKVPDFRLKPIFDLILQNAV
jgi:hypothetical protein